MKNQVENALTLHENEQMVQRRGMHQLWDAVLKEEGSEMIHIDAKSKYHYPQVHQAVRSVPLEKYTVHAIGTSIILLDFIPFLRTKKKKKKNGENTYSRLVYRDSRYEEETWHHLLARRRSWQ
jgi:hypothetical protein